MWEKPWKVREGILVCTGLVIIGLVLQYCAGYVNWTFLAQPINIVIVILYLIVLSSLYTLRNKLYFVRWAMTYHAAVPSLIFAIGITLIMGLTKQTQTEIVSGNTFNLNMMLSFWPFVLIYLWMTTILGLISIQSIHRFSIKKLPFICNHLGLFIAIVCGTLGNADMKRVTMNTRIGETEWRGTEKNGKLVELPVAIQLNSFSINEYPPKLLIISNETGKAVPYDNPEHILVENINQKSTIYNWNIEICNIIENAASNATKDSVKFVEWPNIGATTAVYIKAVSPNNSIIKEGWVSCGSFMFPYNALKINDDFSIIMPDREAKSYISNVNIYSESGKKFKTDIEVNKPAKIDGWKIYQLSYDESKGKWSDISIFELVYDPWLPFVYTGIILMIIGALCMFLRPNKSKEETK